MTVVAAIGQHS